MLHLHLAPIRNILSEHTYSNTENEKIKHMLESPFATTSELRLPHNKHY